MAKVIGQNVPSDDKHAYESSLELARADGTVRKRFPFQVVNHELPKQTIQRNRFKKAIAIFNNVTYADRQRWYAARPVWHSFLWYYNYCIMSALAGNANIQDGGAGVIKTIQVVKAEVPTTGTKSFAINTVDPAKTVVMVHGNSFISDLIQRGSNTVNNNSTVDCALSPSVDIAIAEVKLQGDVGAMEMEEGSGSGDWASPYVSALITSKLTVGLPDVRSGVTCKFSFEIIEHKAQTVFPVLVSIAAEAVVVDWSKAPSVAADVSIIVIEYI